MYHFKLRVYGIVQGVGFRWYIERIAKKLGLKGYVKNEIDGTVIIEVEGETDIIKNLLKYLKIGNGYSHVTEIKIEEQTNIEDFKFTDFTIKF